MAFLEMVSETRQVEHMLHRLDIAISPKGLATFLQGEVDPYLRGRADERFAEEGDDVVGQWAPLKEATVAIRASQGYGPEHPINVRTGELEEYITQGNAATTIFPWGAGITLPGTPPSGELLDKMMRAQAGDERTVPRPVLGMNQNDTVAVLLLLARYIKDAIAI